MSNLGSSEIVLIGEWLTHPDGTTISVPKHKAQEMVDRGVARFKKKPIEQKSIDEPPMHKMVTAAPVKKAGRPKKVV